jgi:hypothetical protein
MPWIGRCIEKHFAEVEICFPGNFISFYLIARQQKQGEHNQAPFADNLLLQNTGDGL